MRILFVGDIVGSIGRQTIKKLLPEIKEADNPHIIIVNGENTAAGKGITEKIYQEFLVMGVQMITMGNHTWDNREIYEFIDEAKYLVRPANFSKKAPGKGMQFIRWNEYEIAVINLQGRTFLYPSDDPFQVVDQLITEAKKRTPIIFVDFHAEATSEKQAMGWYLAGRVSAVVGTHTHVQTADERILPNGTAYLTDVGMTGAYDSILGVDKEIVLKRFLTNMPTKFEIPKNGRVVLSGVIIDIDVKTGGAKAIKRILLNDLI